MDTVQLRNNTPLQEEELLDDEEQEQIIHDFEQKSQFQGKIYRALFSTFGCILAIVYFYLSYAGDDFGEAIGRFSATIVHFMTGCGFLINVYRLIMAKRFVKDSLDSESHYQETKFSFYFLLLIQSFEFLLFAYPLYRNLNGISPIGIFNWNLVLFPFIPFIFALLSEYSLNLLVQMDFDIFDLNASKYHFKKL